MASCVPRGADAARAEQRAYAGDADGRCTAFRAAGAPVFESHGATVVSLPTTSATRSHNQPGSRWATRWAACSSSATGS